MKRLFCSILVLLFSLNLSAQEDKSVAVHLGEGTSLESLLAGYGKESIKTLVVTGTPTLDDYAYIRTQEFFDKSGANGLKLDMKSAAVDTIPAKAFYALDSLTIYRFHFVLPRSLTFIGDSAFAGWTQMFFQPEFEVTGPFPKTGKAPFSRYDWMNVPIPLAWYWTVSDDNVYCVEEDYGIYSADLKVLYIKSSPYYDGWEADNVLPGTEFIAENAFSFRYLFNCLVIPESVKRISDYAFESICLPMTSNGDILELGILCMSKEPPLLGKEAFANNDYNKDRIFIFVPDDCVDVYKNAEGWKDAPFKIYPMSEKDSHNGIEPLVDSETAGYDKAIYDLQGRPLKSASQKGLFIQGGKKHIIR